MKRALRPIRIEGDVAYVPLTQGYEAIVDAASVPLIEAWNWRVLVTRWTVYAVRTDRSGPRPQAVLMHRLLMGNPSNMVVDHKNGDGFDNRRANLRVATRQQNACNRRINFHSTSGFKGVSWYRASQKWRAHIGQGGTKQYLGSFDTPEAAYAAYCEASQHLHGEFGRPT